MHTLAQRHPRQYRAHAIGTAGGVQDKLVGGDSPELAARLAPMLEKFGRDLDSRVTVQTSELLTKAVKQFDPDDPTSPMSKHTRELEKQQQTLSAALEQPPGLGRQGRRADHRSEDNHLSQGSRRVTGKITTLKGESYAAEVHQVMEQIAAGLGDEYADTGAIPGAVPRSKKGDGVLAINGGSARIVLEVTTSKRPNWTGYLDEAERNRSAAASLGLVRTPAQNNGSTVRGLGPRRIVIAFDPATDDPELLRTVIQLLRLSALTAADSKDAALSVAAEAAHDAA